VYVNFSLHIPGRDRRTQEVEAPGIFRQSAFEGDSVVSPVNWPPLSARRYSWKSFLLGSDLTSGLSAAGTMKPMDISNDPFGKRTRDLPACSAVPQTTWPPRT